MGNRVNFLEEASRLAAQLEGLVTNRATADGVVTASERQEINLIHLVQQGIAEKLNIENLCAFLNKGGRPNEYSNRLASPLGIGLIDLTAEREARKVVPFPGADEYA